MRRALLAAASVAGVSLSSMAGAQGTTCNVGQLCDNIPAYGGSPRDNAVSQAVANTLCVHFTTRGIGCQNATAVGTFSAVDLAVLALAAQGSGGNYGPSVTQANRTWQQVIRGLALYFPSPVDFGGPVGNYTGGGGAGGTWDPSSDCDRLQLKFDAEGNWIIPSYPLAVGAPILFGDYFVSKPNSNPGALGSHTIGNNHESRARRVAHLWNMTRAQPTWFGVVGPMPDGLIHFATVAYRWPTSGYLQGRETMSQLGQGSYEGPHLNTAPGQDYGGAHTFEHKPCPPSSSGGVFHYYGYTDWSGYHLHSCVQFIPDGSFGWGGYAINKETTLPWPVSGWPNGAPQHIKDCPLSPEFLARLTNGIYKYASEQPGYAGVPHEQVTTEQGRPNDTRVSDLGDNPSEGDTTATPNSGTTTQPPTSTPTGSSNVNVTVDFGPDPGVGAPTVDDPPTGIMDPIFEWLPDLPSLSLESQASACPTWAVNLTEFGGPEWVWLLDSHCPIFEENRALIGGLMLALFGIGAALIILRA